MKIPEVIIFNTLKSFQNIVREDFVTATSEQESILYQLFKEDDNDNAIMMEDYDYYKQAVAILTRDNDVTRQLQFNIGYNMKRVGVPTVHILMPNENKGRIDTLGHSEEDIIDEIGDRITIEKTRSNSSVYYLMITSDNSSEVMIIYYWLKAMFLLFHENLEILGLMNLSHSGQDINLQNDLAPPNIFHRNLSLSFDYESSAKIRITRQTIDKIQFGICKNFNLGVQNSMNDNSAKFVKSVPKSLEAQLEPIDMSDVIDTEDIKEQEDVKNP